MSGPPLRDHVLLAPNAKMRAQVVPQTPIEPADAAQPGRVRGELKIIAVILEPPVIERILTHLGLQARAPLRARARGQALQAA